MLMNHPSPIGNGWELVNGHCRPIRYTRPALPDHLLQVANIDETNENVSDSENYNSDEQEDSELEIAGSD